jgi:hypothetical protein
MKLKHLLPLLALPLLAACAPQVESTVYVSDLQKVLADNQALATPALIRIPQGGEDDCKKGLAALVEKFKALAPTTGKAQCISKDSDELAEIETQIQIVTKGSSFDPVNLLTLEIGDPDADGNATLALHMLKPVADIVKALADENAMSTEMDPTKFTLHINNDGRDAMSLVPGEVFIDGKPHLMNDGPVSIDRRGEIEIKFSDVASAFTEQGNSYIFATFPAK